MKGTELLLVTTSYPQSGDGSEAAGGFVADFVAAVSRHVPVRVVAPGLREEVEDARDGVRLFRFSAPGRPLSLLSPHRVGDWPNIALTLSSLNRQTLAAGMHGSVGHTLALWALPSGWAARHLARRAGVPYSVWALGSDIWSLGRIPVVRTVLSQVLQGATACFADGLQLADDARRLSGREFEFLPSSRKLARSRLRRIAGSPPWRLIFLGRWHPNKGVDLLLEALKLLDESAWMKIADVYIAGGGPLESVVRAQACELATAGRPVRVGGYLGKDEATNALECADFLLLPSRIESIPVVFSDAMKMRLPVISTPVGDMTRLIGGGDSSVGVVSDQVSPAAFAAAITKAIQLAPTEREVEIERMAARFDVEKTALRVLERLDITSPLRAIGGV